MIWYNKKSGYPCLRKQKGETDMTLNQIIYFQKVARLENYHLAAEELYVSQPSLSRSMASLEQELGVPLFEKRGRGVNLTKAGKLFLEYADRIVEECRVAMEKMSELASDGGRIEIGYVFPLAGQYIPCKVKEFLERPENRRVVFGFWQNHTSAIAEKVKSGELDIGFGGCIEKEGMEHFPILNQEVLIVTPKGHELEGQEEVPLQVLDRYPVIGYDQASWMGTHTKYLYRKYGVHPDLIAECPDEYSILAMVKRNFGIALMPETDFLAGEDQVNVHRLKDLSIYHQVFMFWMKERYRLPAVERFLQYIKEEARKEEMVQKNDRLNASKIYLKDIVNF